MNHYEPRAYRVGAGLFAVAGNHWDLVPDRSVDDVTISVVIPYFCDQAMLDLVLAGLSVQSVPRSRLQVVISDDGSPEPPRISEFAAGLDPIVVRQADKGFRPGTARNLGVECCDGQVIAFLDGDTIPTPDYLENLCRLPSMIPDAVVGGRRRYAQLAGWTAPEVLEWFGGNRTPPAEIPEPEWLTNEYRRTGDLLRTNPRSYKYLIGAVLAFSRNMFIELGGFDETIVGYGGEDYDLTYRAHTAGAVFAYVPSAVAWHHGPDWAGRTSDRAAGRDQKNRETLMLAARIPEPSARGEGQWYANCDIAVEVDISGWTLGAAILCLRSLLALGDLGLWLVGSEPSIGPVLEVMASDCRVSLGPAPAGVLARARVRLTLAAPILAGAELGHRIRRMIEEDVGELVVTIDGADAAVARTTRSSGREQRWADRIDRSEGFSGFFESWRLEGSEADVQLIDGEPLLPAIFGHWG